MVLKETLYFNANETGRFNYFRSVFASCHSNSMNFVDSYILKQILIIV